MKDDDRDWCLRQWEILRSPLLDKALQNLKDKRVVVDRNASASSSDIVHLEDSQESEAGGCAQVAVLQNGTTRALTQEEQAEIAYHEELECRAAEGEAKADEHRWELFRAQCLQEEEDQAMKDAMEESVLEQPYKKAKVKVIVEGTGGRVVRSEVFNMVVQASTAQAGLNHGVGRVACKFLGVEAQPCFCSPEHLRWLRLLFFCCGSVFCWRFREHFLLLIGAWNFYLQG